MDRPRLREEQGQRDEIYMVSCSFDTTTAQIDGPTSSPALGIGVEGEGFKRVEEGINRWISFEPVSNTVRAGR